MIVKGFASKKVDAHLLFRPRQVHSADVKLLEMVKVCVQEVQTIEHLDLSVVSYAISVG